MNLKPLLLLCLLLPAVTFGQSIHSPLVASSDDPTTVITQVETNSQHTVVSFRHICHQKGSWVQLNKSMYLQDADGEDRYDYVKSEGIPLRPEQFVATKDNEEVNFKVYFEKVKPGTKEINVIERARSLAEMGDGITYFNYFRVNLNKSRPLTADSEEIDTEEVTMMPSPSMDRNGGVDMAYPTNNDFGSSMGNMYTSILNAQLKTYSDPAVTDQLAKITRNYYNALIKAGFSMDAALKIITSKQLISMDGAK